MDSDYLISCSVNLLLQHGLTGVNVRATDLQELVLLYLHKLFLKEVTLVQSCTSLRVCTLSNNFITSIRPLRACPHLIKLDLGGNQIEKLPDQEFWKELKDLRLLYLHDNQISGVSNVESLSFCPNLIGLTMFDTPLSLHKRYRHIVVNSIWSLKALDEYVISDQEIIEDWSLEGRFKAQNHHLYLNLSPVPCQDVQDLSEEMKGVTDLIAKINHVLSHCSPVLIVQRWIRGFLTRKRQGIISPLKIQREKLHSLSDPGKEENMNGARVTKILIRDLSALPFSRDSKTGPLIKQVLPNVEIDYDPGNKIQQRSMASRTDSLRGEKKMKEIKSAVFPKKDHEKTDEKETEGKGFRLLGLNATVHESMSLKYLMESHEESARNMRECIQLLHNVMQSKEQPVHRVQAPKPSTASKETITMNMRALHAVDNAYEKRHKSDILTKKKDLTTQILTSRLQAKHNIQGFKEEKRKNFMKQNEKDSISFQQDLDRMQLTRLNLIEARKQRQKQISREKQRKASEHSFVKEFSTQHTSVSNTLLKHDMMLKKEEGRQEKICFVERVKENKEQQKEFIKCLKEHRQLILQIENASEKASLNSDALQKAEDRLCEARGHVTSMKGQHVTAQPMFTIPVIQPGSQAMCYI